MCPSKGFMMHPLENLTQNCTVSDIILRTVFNEKLYRELMKCVKMILY